MQELQLREYQEKCDLCDFLTVVRVLVPDMLLLSISKKLFFYLLGFSLLQESLKFTQTSVKNKLTEKRPVCGGSTGWNYVLKEIRGERPNWSGLTGSL